MLELLLDVLLLFGEECFAWLFFARAEQIARDEKEFEAKLKAGMRIGSTAFGEREAY